MLFCPVFVKYLSELKVFRSNVGRKIIKLFMSKCTFLNSYFDEVKEQRPKVPYLILIYRVIISVLDPRKCEYLKYYSLDLNMHI